MIYDNRNAFWTLLVLIQLAAAACGQESNTPVTQVLVTVDSDIRDDVSKVEVQILDVRAEVAGSGHLFEIKGDDTWPVSFAVSPTRGREGGSFLVVARGSDAQGELLSETKGLLTFIKGKTTTAALWLLAACRGVTCAGLQTCVGRGSQAGVCDSVPVLDTEVVEPGSQPTTSAGVPPMLMPPAEPTGMGTSSEMNPAMPGTESDGGMSTSSGGSDAGTDAQVIVPRVENTPTLGGFSTLCEPRRNSGGLLLLDDGFELGERTCNSAGLCATASFAP